MFEITWKRLRLGLIELEISLIELEIGLRINKAVYTAALVAEGWAGAENLKKRLCDRRTDGPTDQPKGPKSGL